MCPADWMLHKQNCLQLFLGAGNNCQAGIREIPVSWHSLVESPPTDGCHVGFESNKVTGCCCAHATTTNSTRLNFIVTYLQPIELNCCDPVHLNPVSSSTPCRTPGYGRQCGWSQIAWVAQSRRQAEQQSCSCMKNWLLSTNQGLWSVSKYVIAVTQKCTG